MKTAMLLFPGFTALDAIGPYHALASMPGWDFTFVAEHAGPVSNGGSFTMDAPVAISDIGQPDLLVVPGGISAIELAGQGGPLIDWIRDVHPGTTWTASVCTGALMLGAAGILDGLRATTHWYTHARLADYGAIPVDQRVVRDGKVLTAAGVSAGIDMSLTLAALIAGEHFAQAAQLDMEYDPQPPFRSGHPNSAPPDVYQWLRTMYDGMLPEQ